MQTLCNEKACRNDTGGASQYCLVHFPLFQVRPILFVLEKIIEPLPLLTDPKNIIYIEKVYQIEQICRFIFMAIQCMKVPDPELLPKLIRYSDYLDLLKASFNCDYEKIFTEKKENAKEKEKMENQNDERQFTTGNTGEIISKGSYNFDSKEKKLYSTDQSEPPLKARIERKRKIKFRSKTQKNKIFVVGGKFPKRRRKRVKRIFREKVIAEDDTRERVIFQGRSYVNYGMRYFKCEFRGCVGRIKEIQKDDYEVYKGHSSKCHLDFRRKTGKGPVYKRTKKEKYLDQLSKMNQFGQNNTGNPLI